MKKTVYIETTIPSYYYETREDARSVAWRDITIRWWKHYRKYYQSVSSEFVLLELDKGHHPKQKDKIDLLRGLELLEPLPIISEIAEHYIKNRLIPREYGGDAFHLAFASYYETDFLLTWNCRHLANPNKFKHFEVINKSMDLSVPVLCTPAQLLTTED